MRRLMFTFKDLDAWKTGMDVVEGCYRATEPFPLHERYGLTSQLRRAAVSIPSNVAEGHGRRTTGAYLNHVSIAIGSQAELETCVELAHRLHYFDETKKRSLLAKIDPLGRMLYGLHRSLE